MSVGNLEELGKAFVKLGELLQDKSSNITELAEAADKCGLRLGVAIQIADDQPAKPSAGGDHAQ